MALERQMERDLALSKSSNPSFTDVTIKTKIKVTTVLKGSKGVAKM
jgi:hypothetical protein